MTDFRKYPRIRHLPGSARHGDDDRLPWAALADIVGRSVVITEKLDGANAGLSFLADGSLQLQSRGHVLTGGARERHFALFKAWAQAHADALRERLADRYVLYGEWLYARHTVFYDALPHYFIVFDGLDRSTERFLSRAARDRLLEGLPVVTAPQLFAGTLIDPGCLDALARSSACKTAQWRRSLQAATEGGEVAEWGNGALAIAQTDPSDEAEGFVIAVEEDEAVVDRVKWVRPSFVEAMVSSGSHWLSRPILANQLAEGVTLW